MYRAFCIPCPRDREAAKRSVDALVFSGQDPRNAVRRHQPCSLAIIH